jgi:hypothetical protein
MAVDPGVIPAVPEPVPSSSDPVNFNERADATLSAFPAVVAAMNVATAATKINAELAEAAAAIAEAASDAAVSATGVFALVNDNLALGAGAKNITGLVGKEFQDGNKAYLFRRSDPTVWQYGTLSAANMGAGTITLTVASGDFNGAGGPYNDWYLIDATLANPPQASVADVRQGTDYKKSVSPGVLNAAAAFQALTAGATTAWDVAQGWDAKYTATANQTLGAPTNMQDGLVYAILVNPATFVVSYNAIYNFGAAGAPSLPASVWSKLVGQYDAARNKLDISGIFRGA